MSKKIIVLLVVLVFLLFAGLAVLLLLDVNMADFRPANKSAQEEIEKYQASLPSKENDSKENRQAWRDHLNWSDQCEQGELDDFLPADFKQLNFYSLSDEDEYLVQIMCFLGAYQGTYEFVYFNEKTRESKPLSFNNYYQENGVVGQATETSLCGDPAFSDGVLTSFCKGRGLGDCGHVYEYKFDDEKKELETVEVKVEEKCEGNYDRDSWEVIYPK